MTKEEIQVLAKKHLYATNIGSDVCPYLEIEGLNEFASALEEAFDQYVQSIRTEDEVVKPYRELLSDINCKLAMLEERIHGEDGDIITYIRGDINNILYRKNASTN